MEIVQRVPKLVAQAHLKGKEASAVKKKVTEEEEEEKKEEE